MGPKARPPTKASAAAALISDDSRRQVLASVETMTALDSALEKRNSEVRDTRMQKAMNPGPKKSNAGHKQPPVSTEKENRPVEVQSTETVQTAPPSVEQPVDSNESQSNACNEPPPAELTASGSEPQPTAGQPTNIEPTGNEPPTEIPTTVQLATTIDCGPQPQPETLKEEPVEVQLVTATSRIAEEASAHESQPPMPAGSHAGSGELETTNHALVVPAVDESHQGSHSVEAEGVPILAPLEPSPPPADRKLHRPQQQMQTVSDAPPKKSKPRKTIDPNAAPPATVDPYALPPLVGAVPSTESPQVARAGRARLHDVHPSEDPIIKSLEAKLKERRSLEKIRNEELARRSEALQKAQEEAQMERETREKERKAEELRLKHEQLAQRLQQLQRNEEARLQRIQAMGLKVNPDFIAGKRSLLEIFEEKRKKSHEEDEREKQAKMDAIRARRGPSDLLDDVRRHEEVFTKKRHDEEQRRKEHVLQIHEQAAPMRSTETKALVRALEQKLQAQGVVVEKDKSKGAAEHAPHSANVADEPVQKQQQQPHPPPSPPPQSRSPHPPSPPTVATEDHFASNAATAEHHRSGSLTEGLEAAPRRLDTEVGDERHAERGGSSGHASVATTAAVPVVVEADDSGVVADVATDAPRPVSDVAPSTKAEPAAVHEVVPIAQPSAPAKGKPGMAPKPTKNVKPPTSKLPAK